MLLGTVRRKLIALVAASALAALAVLPVLSWLLHRQLVDEVDARIPEAIAGFQQELADDVVDLDVSATAIAGEAATAVALGAHDAAALAVIAQPFHAAYPDLDILFFDGDGKLLYQIGCQTPRPTVPKRAARGEHVVLAHGCELGEAAPVAVANIQALPVGSVMICLPLDHSWFTNAQKKLGGELALEVTNPRTHEGKRYVQYATARFPQALLVQAEARRHIRSDGDETWAIQQFVPASVTSADNRVEVMFTAALDVTGIRAIVRRHLLFALAILVSTTLAAVLLGWRLASRMSRALSRVNHAMRKLEQQEYVKVEAVKTGDELEDLAEGFNAMVDGLQERDKLRTTMGKYMTEAVVAHLLAGELELGGKTLEVSILFCDLRDFTTLSETRSAQQIVELLNEYFTELVECVMAEGGVVDKYIGDNIMAVFGAPVSRPDDAVHAVRAAVHMREALARLNAKFRARGADPLRFGIGIHTGEVVAGNIGSAKRMEYTVIGDAVNVAARLETKTKELATDLLISEQTYRRAQAGLDAEPAGDVTVKGRQQPVAIYKVRGLTPRE